MQNFCLEAAFRILLKTMNGNLGELKYFRTAKRNFALFGKSY
jgi:hypothetical protein